MRSLHKVHKFVLWEEGKWNVISITSIQYTPYFTRNSNRTSSVFLKADLTS